MEVDECASADGSATDGRRDQIARIECFPVLPRWLFVRIETRQGAVGWGEATLEGHAEAVVGALDAAQDRLIGHDPDRIEDAWQMLYRLGFYRGGPVLLSALSGIDQALWDIKARKLGVPVYQLLGGRVRDRIPVYAWIGGDSPRDVVVQAEARKAQGFSAVKMNATGDIGWLDSWDKVDSLVERLGSVRATGMDVGVDFHGRVHKPMARQMLRAIESLHPLFAEEVLLSENAIAFEQWPLIPLCRLQWASDCIAGGNVAHSLKRARLTSFSRICPMRVAFLNAGRIAAMAETYDVAFAPHCPIGPLALASCLHLAAVTPNFVMQEMSLGIHYNGPSEDLVTLMKNPELFAVSNGCVDIPELPGLGVEIDEVAVREMACNPHRWRNPAWRGPPGGAAGMVSCNVLITGGLGDIGLAVALDFARDGANIVLLDKREDDGSATRMLHGAGAGEVVNLACDVGDADAIEKAVDHGLARFGSLDVIVNVAGMMIFKALAELTADDWRRLLDINLVGAALLTGHALRVMRPGGCVVNVASIHAHRTSALVAPYAAAKSAMLSLTRSAAIEGKPLGIRVNAVLPGAVDTQMLRASPNIASGEEVIDPADVGSPAQIAAVVRFLASDAASFINGEGIVADGGRMGRL